MQSIIKARFDGLGNESSALSLHDTITCLKTFQENITNFS